MADGSRRSNHALGYGGRRRAVAACRATRPRVLQRRASAAWRRSHRRSRRALRRACRECARTAARAVRACSASTTPLARQLLDRSSAPSVSENRIERPRASFANSVALDAVHADDPKRDRRARSWCVIRLFEAAMIGRAPGMPLPAMTRRRGAREGRTCRRASVAKPESITAASTPMRAAERMRPAGFQKVVQVPPRLDPRPARPQNVSCASTRHVPVPRPAAQRWLRAGPPARPTPPSAPAPRPGWRRARTARRGRRASPSSMSLSAARQPCASTVLTNGCKRRRIVLRLQELGRELAPRGIGERAHEGVEPVAVMPSDLGPRRAPVPGLDHRRLVPLLDQALAMRTAEGGRLGTLRLPLDVLPQDLSEAAAARARDLEHPLIAAPRRRAARR